jgi:hypothetical protein
VILNVNLPFFTIPFAPQPFSNLIKFQSAEQLLAQDNKWRRTMIGANPHLVPLCTIKHVLKNSLTNIWKPRRDLGFPRIFAYQ